MIKKEIYPKTQRVSCLGDEIYITEKLDASNLVIFKKNENLYFAQRKNIFSLGELEEVKGILYKGLYQWIKDNSSYLQEHLLNNAALCGEWLGMGQIKYSIDEFDKRFYIFAKANIDEEFNIYNLRYNHDLFAFPFDNCVIPSFIGIVPEVMKLRVLPNKVHLDNLYKRYTKIVQRKVEGFVINYKDSISKYVRLKNGKLQEHFDRGDSNDNK